MDKINLRPSKNHYLSLQRVFLNLFFGLTLVIIITINIGSYYQISKFTAANFLVAHTYQVTQASDNLLLSILNIESLARGYMITGDSMFIKNLDQKINHLFDQITLIKNLTFDSSQREKLQHLSPLFKLRIELIEQTISLKKNGKLETPEGIAMVRHAQNISQQIKTILTNFNGKEFSLLKQRDEIALYNLHRINWFIISTSVITLFIIFFSLIAFNRQLTRQLAMEKAALMANEKLKLAYQELKEHDEAVSLLNQMDTLLQTCTTTDEALELIRSYCKKLLPFSAGIIYLTHRSGDYLVARTNWNNPQNCLRTFLPNQCLGLRQGKPYSYLNQPENICCKHYMPQPVIQGYFCVPLLAQNEQIGLLYLEIKKIEHRTEEQMNQTAESYKLLINNLAGLIALSVANIRLKNTLRTRSIRDPLTNLYNRTYFNESLEQELHRTDPGSMLLAITMLDIDHFKTINDTFGHQAGDLILKALGDLLLKEVRKSDIACRYGGEEFLLAIYDTPLNVAISRAEHIRKKISQMKFHFTGQTITSITASLGIAIYPEHGETINKVIKAADQALYQSKKTGRNKVTVYEKPPQNTIQTSPQSSPMLDAD